MKARDISRAKDIAAIVKETVAPEVSEEVRRTGARINALLRHLFVYDRGNMIRVVEKSGLSLTQFKVLFELGALSEATDARQITALAATLGVSVPSMSRAVESLVQQKLISRAEDAGDRRVRQIAITTKGKRLIDAFLTVRQASMEAFAAGLTVAQRRKLDAGVDALMDRRDIAETYRHLKDGPA